MNIFILTSTNVSLLFSFRSLLVTFESSCCVSCQFGTGCLKKNFLLPNLALNGPNSASRRTREVPKKGKSSEFNPENYEHVKSSPSLKVWWHESVKDAVKFDKWVNLRSAKKYPKKI